MLGFGEYHPNHFFITTEQHLTDCLMRLSSSGFKGAAARMTDLILARFPGNETAKDTLIDLLDEHIASLPDAKDMLQQESELEDKKLFVSHSKVIIGDMSAYLSLDLKIRLLGLIVVLCLTNN